jgi:PAS domain-containing protein
MSNTPKLEDQESEALRRRLAELEMVSSFHEEAGRILGPFPSAGALQELLDLIRTVRDRSAVFLKVEESTGTRARGGLPGRIPKVKIGDGLPGRVATEGKPLREESPEKGSALAVPVRVSGRTLGVLDLSDVATGKFTDGVTAAVESAACRLALFLDSRPSEPSAESKREDRYRAIVENAAYPIMTLDPAGNFTWANRATLSLLGYGRGELDGVNVTQIIRKGHVRTIFTAIRSARKASRCARRGSTSPRAGARSGRPRCPATRSARTASTSGSR